MASLFIITGDHGMRDTGGHGGNSYAEVNVPFIVFGLQCTPSTYVFAFQDLYNRHDLLRVLQESLSTN